MSGVPFDVVWDRLADIDGWLSESQARALYDAASRCPAGGRIVEIGSFRGRSTIVLATAAPDGAEVVAIDPHAGNDRGPQEIDGYGAAANDDHDQFGKNLEAAGVRERVRHIREFSDRAHDLVDGSIDVLFIDGAHRLRPARTDVRDWGRRVAPGGVLAIHDAFSSIGVTGAILTELLASTDFRYCGRHRSLALYRAATLTGPRARATNIGRQTAQLPWFVRNVALKILLAAGLGGALRPFGREVPDWPY